MTNLTVVPDIEEHQDFDELMVIAIRIVESAIDKVPFDDIAREVAPHLVTDQEDVSVIARLTQQLTIDVYYTEQVEEPADG